MNIQANDLKRQYELHSEEYKKKAAEVLDSGWYVLGKELSEFEKEWADYIGVKHCVGVASGLDALIMAFRIIGIEPGDEVIVSSNAYIACVMGITINGGTPIFVEPDEFNNIDASKIEDAITSRTKAILAVHLFGQCCDMDTICNLGENTGYQLSKTAPKLMETPGGGARLDHSAISPVLASIPQKDAAPLGMAVR